MAKEKSEEEIQSSNTMTAEVASTMIEQSQNKTEDTMIELRKYFIKSIQDIYYAEHAIEEKLGEIKAKATSEALIDALEDHQLVTKKQVLRLEKVFKHLNETPKKSKCEAIIGILKEGDEMISEAKNNKTLRDIAVILSCQKVEHYEIASYNGLIQ